MPQRYSPEGSPIFDNARLAELADPTQVGPAFAGRRLGADYTVDVSRPSSEQARIRARRQFGPESTLDPLIAAKAFLARPSVVSSETAPPTEGADPFASMSFPRYAAEAVSGKGFGTALTAAGHPILGGLADMATYSNPLGTALSGLQQLVAPEADQSRLGGALDVAFGTLPLAGTIRRGVQAAKALTTAEEAKGIVTARTPMQKFYDNNPMGEGRMTGQFTEGPGGLSSLKSLLPENAPRPYQNAAERAGYPQVEADRILGRTARTVPSPSDVMGENLTTLGQPWSEDLNAGLNTPVVDYADRAQGWREKARALKALMLNETDPAVKAAQKKTWDAYQVQARVARQKGHLPRIDRKPR